VSDGGGLLVPRGSVFLVSSTVEKEETIMALPDGPTIAAETAPREVAAQATPGRLAGVTVGLAAPAEHAAAAGVVARGMRDNPLHVAVHGEDPALRLRRLRRLFAGALDVLDWPLLVARRDDGTIVGVCGMAPPGACRPGAGQQLRLLPHVLALGPRAFGRAGRWMGAWRALDLPERHWHLGPVAVDAGL
jgi:hypothetical protein